MKKQIIILFTGLTLLSSCYDAMNEVPLERMPPEIAFKDSLKVEMFVNELYVGLNTGIGGYNSFGGGAANQNSFFDCVTDLGVLSPRGTKLPRNQSQPVCRHYKRNHFLFDSRKCVRGRTGG